LPFNYSFDDLALRIGGPFYINYSTVLTEHCTSWLIVTSARLGDAFVFQGINKDLEQYYTQAQTYETTLTQYINMGVW